MTGALSRARWDMNRHRQLRELITKLSRIRQREYLTESKVHPISRPVGEEIAGGGQSRGRGGGREDQRLRQRGQVSEGERRRERRGVEGEGRVLGL